MYYSKIPHKFYQLKKIFGNKSFKLLDVGCGNHSPSQTKQIFKNCTYHGVDLELNPEYFESDKSAIEKMFVLNLDNLNLEEIENNHYDAIIMCHVIEHLEHGEKVLELLNKKLKSGGIFYIECPSPNSVNFPSKKGTLNFYDDPTHVRIYPIENIISTLSDQNHVISFGVVRSMVNLILTPYKIIKSIVMRGYIRGYVLWDLYGFANFVLFKKK